MKIALVSTYELGHQPFSLATAAAALRAAGHATRALDLAVEQWDDALVEWADAVAVSVPMHTAARLAQGAINRIRSFRGDLPVCVFGLYADAIGTEGVRDRFSGEYEPALVDWAASVDARGGAGESGPGALRVGGRKPGPELPGPTRAAQVRLQRRAVKAVDRDGLPALDRYARLLIDGEERLAGYVEASRGCAHRCKHCPVPVVYDGRVRLVDVDVVLGDVERLVAAGARHLTFGDPDFLNAPQHSRRVVAAMHAAFPDLTFDCTAKVSHLLAHADVWPEWAEAGCLFVVSAFESVDDAILRRLDKGHTAADAAAAVDVLRLSAIEIRPSFLPFTPWTHLGHLAELTDFVVDHDLAGNVDPVQYTIRLLLPPGSLLLGDDGLAPHLLSPTDGDGDLAVPWASADPAVDRLHAEVSGFVEDSLAAGNPPETTFSGVRNVAYAACGRPPPPPSRVPRRPRLSEPWFCCAEPTQGQALAVAPERLATGGRAD